MTRVFRSAWLVVTGTFLCCAGRCQCSREKMSLRELGMSDDAEMAEYRLQRTYLGRPCEVYFFGTWTGYSHPVTPRQPLRYREALSRRAFYKAYLTQAQFGTAFVLFKKQMYKRTSVELRVPLASNGTAERYFIVLHEGDSVMAGKEIAPQEAVDVEEYLYARFPSSVEALKRVELVQIDGWYSYEYFYNDEGRFVKGVLESERRTTVLEPGQEPREFIKEQ